MKIAFLLVTCCLERSRSEILAQVIKNLQEQAPEIQLTITVFDNASTEVGTIDVLRDCFSNVYRADHNVGYWSAIDWWLELEHLSGDPPAYTYVIESDMIHYAFSKLWECAGYLDTNPDVGSVRLHQYSVTERYLYDKDRPQKESHRNLWQSHTNRATGLPVKLDHSIGDIWSTTFLTQLPALNRYRAMKEVFAELRSMPRFTEFDFQRRYWQRYHRTAILDGGIFHCDLNPFGAKTITGSWTNEVDLNRIGYQTTRNATILDPGQYNVRRC